MMLQSSKYLVIIGIVVLIVLVLAGGGFLVLASQLAPVSSDTAERTFTVSAGEGVKTIAANLQEAGLIRNTFVFELYIWAEGLSSNLQAGEYLLHSAMDLPMIVRTLARGEALANEITIRLVEGWTSQEIGQYLANERSLFSLEEWNQTVNVTDSRLIIPGQTFAVLTDKPNHASLEGYLFPDTYRVFKDATPAAVIEKMLRNFEEKLTPQLRTSIVSQGRTMFEVITLASIVEREVQTDLDRRLVADIFLRRLAAGIPLEADSTVNFVTGKKTPQVSFEDVNINSPYNTYRTLGLPPGPISNPGLSSIHAVIQPEPNNYFYFLTTERGQTIFSTTFDEHKENKAKYLGN